MVKPEMADNEAKLLELFRAQFARIETIGREDFVKTIREEILPLSYIDKIPCTLIILDEVQQFIGQTATWLLMCNYWPKISVLDLRVSSYWWVQGKMP